MCEKKYLTGATDPFLEVLSLIKKVYSPKFECSQEEIETFNMNKAEKLKTDMVQSKKPRLLLQPLMNNLNSSLDDSQLR